MKIEMGESLFYSWLRHVKECQIVQTNWKVSPQWLLDKQEELEAIMTEADTHFSEKYGYRIFKKNRSLSQLIQQGECDALGVSVQPDGNHYYAVDVAFHEDGLNYGTREETVMKVVAKSLRTAMCLYGYMGTEEADIIFASPKINPAVLNDLLPCIDDTNKLLSSRGFRFKIRVIANDAFNEQVLQPILLVSEGVADTSELFLRSYQMYMMFSGSSTPKQRQPVPNKAPQIRENDGAYSELAVGKLANTVLRRVLESNTLSDEEIGFLQQADYCRQFFHIQYPILLRTDDSKREEHYYSTPLFINGLRYRLCCEWFETAANNDRPYLERWLENHKVELR